MSRRALVPLDELRRWAKVSCEQGVEITGHKDLNGGVTVVVRPIGTIPAASNDEFDAAMATFLGKG